MRNFAIQVHSDQSLDIDELIALCGEQFKLDTESDYTNIGIEVDDAYEFWQKLKLTKFIHAYPMIIVCEGEHGWDDYVLLHHYKYPETQDDEELLKGKQDDPA